MKVRFTIKKTYEVNLPKSIAEDYSNRLDYISANAYDLIENEKPLRLANPLMMSADSKRHN